MRSLEIKTIGGIMINLNEVRHTANKKINDALTSTWLDDETIREFIKEQTLLQRYPFTLNKLLSKIQDEIQLRINNYSFRIR